MRPSSAPIERPFPRRWATLAGVARALPALVLASAALSGLPGGALAQATGPGWVPTGQWQFWREASEQVPKRRPALSICLGPKGVQDAVVLVGEAPGDASCKARTPRRTDPQTVVTELECPDGRRLRAVTRFTGDAAFLTRIETLVGRPLDPSPAFVHAQRAGECL